MKFSLIIPTYDRNGALAKTLAALARQSLRDFEVIIVDDGSKEKASEKIDFDAFPFTIRYFYQDNAGPAAARNRALREVSSAAELVLFLGDDIVPAEDFLAQHEQYHRIFSQSNQAVLGLTLWPAELRDCFMDFLAPHGPQFDYSRLADKQKADFRFFYTSNLSLKKSFLDGYSFNESFRDAAFEDTELGYRLEREKGLEIIYNPQALAYHHHLYDFSKFARRQKKNAVWARLLVSLHPELEPLIAKSRWRLAYYLAVTAMFFLFYRLYRLLRPRSGGAFYRFYNSARLQLIFNWHYRFGRRET